MVMLLSTSVGPEQAAANLLRQLRDMQCLHCLDLALWTLLGQRFQAHLASRYYLYDACAPVAAMSRQSTGPLMPTPARCSHATCAEAMSHLPVHAMNMR